MNTPIITTDVKLNGQTISVLTVPAKDFKTGSKGFYGQDKMTIAGKRYQVQCQLVEIGSKEASTEKK